MIGRDDLSILLQLPNSKRSLHPTHLFLVFQILPITQKEENITDSNQTQCHLLETHIQL